jgi:hypothetical protein
MRADEVFLQQLDFVVCYDGVGKLTKSRIDTIDNLTHARRVV